MPKNGTYKKNVSKQVKKLNNNGGGAEEEDAAEAKREPKLLQVPDWIKREIKLANSELGHQLMQYNKSDLFATVESWRDHEEEKILKHKRKLREAVKIEANKTPEQRAEDLRIKEANEELENKISEYRQKAEEEVKGTKEEVVNDGLSIKEVFMNTENKGKGFNQLTSDIMSDIYKLPAKYTDQQIYAFIKLIAFLQNRLHYGVSMYHKDNENIKISRDIINELPKEWQPKKLEGGRTNKKRPKKEILGKMICIYKIPGDRKEYVRHKGKLITVKDYKESMKAKKAKKAKKAN